MTKITFRLPDAQERRIERQVDKGEYPNKSEAIRSYIRNGLKADENAEDGRPAPMDPATGSSLR